MTAEADHIVAQKVKHVREKRAGEPSANGKPSGKAKRKAKADSPIPSGDHPHLTDLGNAKRLIKRHGQDLRYCWPWNKWLCWDGTRWKIDDTGAIMAKAKDTMMAMFGDACERLKSIHKQLEAGDGDEEALKKAAAIATKEIAWALKCEECRMLKAMVELAKSEPGVPILPADLDKDHFALNSPNGTLDLRTGYLRKHSREDWITKLCPVPYDSRAEAPLFQKFLRDIFNADARPIDYVMRLVGYCLTGDVSEQILPIFWGTGANGKSTLLNTMLAMLGTDYGIKGAPDLLMTKRMETHPTEKADLFGKRLVVCVETEDGKKLAEAFVKDVTGGDRQRARRMREDFWEFDPTAKMILATNHKPNISGTDYAIWRRIHLIPFRVTIPDQRKDPKLLDKLRAELPGILALSVQCCLSWQRDGMTPPEEVTEATKEYRNDQDILGAFLDECCFVHREARCKASELYAAYRKWCERTGEKEVTQRRFGMALTERNFGRRKSDGIIWWDGVAPTNRDDRDEADRFPA